MELIHTSRRLPFATLAVATALTASGCSSKTAAEILISPEHENMLGAQIKMELEKGTAEMPAIKYLPPGELRDYVLGLANKVVSLGKMQRPEFTWNVEVIDDPNQVNAFATPGGYLYVFTGLLRAAENEAEVIGVMGHEVAHVLARHYARRLVQTYGLQGLIAIALGNDAGKLSEIGAAILVQGYLLKHSREAETEADEIGARLTSQAGYDPNGLVTFFAKLEMMQGQIPSFLKYLMGHPPPGDRQKHIQDLIAREKLPVGATNAPAFQAMRARLPAGLPMGGGVDGGTRG
jgi:beta-barrel assembly-enhancing protease